MNIKALKKEVGSNTTNRSKYLFFTTAILFIHNNNKQKLQFLIKSEYYFVPKQSSLNHSIDTGAGIRIIDRSTPYESHLKLISHWKSNQLFPIVCHGGQTCKFGFSHNLQFKMYGLIVSNFSVYLIHKYGEEAWDNIRHSIYIRTVRP